MCQTPENAVDAFVQRERAFVEATGFTQFAVAMAGRYRGSTEEFEDAIAPRLADGSIVKVRERGTRRIGYVPKNLLEASPHLYARDLSVPDAPQLVGAR